MVAFVVFENDPDNPFIYMTGFQWRGPAYPYPEAPTAAEYLAFVMKDLEDGGPRGFINSFSNVKRALHLATDTVLHRIGLLNAYRRVAFPDKLKLLGQLGIMEPLSILANINSCSMVSLSIWRASRLVPRIPAIAVPKIA